MRRRILNLIVAFMALVVPFIVSVSPARADPQNDFLVMVNNLRASLGRAALSPNASLNATAQQWTQQMASSGSLAHNPNLATQAPAGWTKIGENVGYGGSVTAVYNALVASSGHYANMADPAFNLTGVGVATDGSGTVWITEDFEAGLAPAPTPPPTPISSPATFIRPTNGATNVDTSVPFSWTAGTGAGGYYLTVGATKGGAELANSGVLPVSQTSYHVPVLPGGRMLWGRIYTFLDGNWNSFRDISFTPVPSQASFIRPTSGAVNVNTTVPFSWTTVAGAGDYYLTVGSTVGGADLVNSGVLPANETSYAVPALPTGKTLWARVYTYIGGNWNRFTDVSFTAAPVQVQAHASFIWPTNGATNVNTTTPFHWTSVPNAGNYWLVVGTSEGAADVLSTGIVAASQTTAVVPSMPAGRTLWGRIYTYNGGLWNYSDVSFTAA